MQTLEKEARIDDTAMAQLARIYVLVLFVLEGLLFAASFLLHIGLRIGIGSLYQSIPDSMLGAGLLISVATAFLAKDRNVWKNEFKSCPLWVRLLTIGVVLYGFICVFTLTAFFPESQAVGLHTISAMSMSITAMSLCLLYAVIWRSSETEAELLKRIRNSFIVATLGSLYLLANNFGYLPHPHR